jgi:hypothetical protein
MLASQNKLDQCTVAAAFDTRAQAETAITQLTNAGFGIDNIGVAMRSHSEEEALIESTGAHKTNEPLVDVVEGGLIGGVVGAILSFGVLSVPGVGPVIAGGVLASAMAGAGIGAASGGVQAALTHIGITEDQANALETRFHAGAAIVTVNVSTLGEPPECPDREGVDTARTILSSNGGGHELAIAPIAEVY